MSVELRLLGGQKGGDVACGLDLELKPVQDEGFGAPSQSLKRTEKRARQIYSACVDWQ